MKSNLYLYGVEPTAKVPQSVIDSRTDLLRQNLENELSRPPMECDYDKVNAIGKAIVFWETINEQ